MGIIFLMQNGGHRKGSFVHVFLKICVKVSTEKGEGNLGYSLSLYF